MFNISDEIRDSVFYLFKTEDDAYANVKTGGTGFFVHWGVNDKDYIYAVTNRHVIEKADAFVIRVNTPQGGVTTIPLTLCDWHNHPNQADIAVARVEPDWEKHKFMPIPIQLFIYPSHIANRSVDIGDDVYMMGRFVHHSGKTINLPSVRSGLISVLPNEHELIPLDPEVNLPDQIAYLIEMRSISGFSGSPVFFHNDVTDWMIKYTQLNERILKNDPILELDDAIKDESLIALLGIDAGNMPITEVVYEQITEEGKTKLKPSPYRSLNHSGFSVVIPAWRILETLDIDIFAKERE